MIRKKFYKHKGGGGKKIRSERKPPLSALCFSSLSQCHRYSLFHPNFKDFTLHWGRCATPGFPEVPGRSKPKQPAGFEPALFPLTITP